MGKYIAVFTGCPEAQELRPYIIDPLTTRAMAGTNPEWNYIDKEAKPAESVESIGTKLKPGSSQVAAHVSC